MAHLFAAGLRFDFLRQSVLKLERLPCTKMSEVNAARQMRNSHQSAQEAVKRLPGLDFVKMSEKNSLFCLVSKQARIALALFNMQGSPHISRRPRNTGHR